MNEKSRRLKQTGEYFRPHIQSTQYWLKQHFKGYKQTCESCLIGRIGSFSSQSRDSRLLSDSMSTTVDQKHMSWHSKWSSVVPIGSYVHGDQTEVLSCLISLPQISITGPIQCLLYTHYCINSWSICRRRAKELPNPVQVAFFHSRVQGVASINNMRFKRNYFICFSNQSPFSNDRQQ